MEQNHKIKMTPVISYVVDRSELKQTYVNISLLQYRWLRTPQYSEYLAIKQLHKDVKYFFEELQKLSNQEPNNLSIYKMKKSLEVHYKNLKDITEAEAE